MFIAAATEIIIGLVVGLVVGGGAAVAIFVVMKGKVAGAQKHST
jgi:hypothetical protein